MRRALKLLRCLATRSYRRALLTHGVAAAVEHELALGALSCQFIIDIGANRGQFALTARNCFPFVRILAFEPLPQAASVFRSIFIDDRHVTLNQAAIGLRCGQIPIHVSRRDDSSSLLPIGVDQVRRFPGTEEAGILHVEIGRLQDYLTPGEIKQPALLKLDVQGYELQALRGCETLLPRIEHIYVECSFIELYTGQALADEVIAWLRAKGFRLVAVFNLVTDREDWPVQADLLFSRSPTQAETH